MSKKYVWKDKEGRKYTEAEITDSHLANIIKLLETRVDCLPFPNFQGEEAQDYSESNFFAEQENLHKGIEYFKKIARDRKASRTSNWNRILNSRFSSEENTRLPIEDMEENFLH